MKGIVRLVALVVVAYGLVRIASVDVSPGRRPGELSDREMERYLEWRDSDEGRERVEELRRYLEWRDR